MTSDLCPHPLNSKDIREVRTLHVHELIVHNFLIIAYAGPEKSRHIRGNAFFHMHHAVLCFERDYIMVTPSSPIHVSKILNETEKHCQFAAGGTMRCVEL